jgi:hypothetical protein
MKSRRTRHCFGLTSLGAVLGALVIALPTAAAASGATALPKTGRYVGTTAQGRDFKITFSVVKAGKDRRAMRSLVFAYTCGGKFARAYVPYQGGSIAISKKGTFYSSNGNDGVFGTFKGSTASGTLAGRLSGCRTGKVQWSARRGG